MKKADWFFVILIMAMGLSCLFISASSFRGMSLVQMGSSIRQVCLVMMVIAAIIGLVYWMIQRKKP